MSMMIKEKLIDENDEIKINEDYKNMIPSPSADETTEILNSLKKNGQKYPVVVNSKNMDLVDGYTRYRLLKSLEIKIWYEKREFKNEKEIMNFILISNVQRRHLRPFDKVRLFRPIYEMEKKEAYARLKKISRHRTKEETGSALERFSTQLKISPTTAKNALVVIDKGTPSQLKMVQNRLVSITRMANVINKKIDVDSDAKLKSYLFLVKNAKGKTVNRFNKKISDRTLDRILNFIRVS
jgi:ParB-like chromosome segregation protein Spo0J